VNHDVEVAVEVDHDSFPEASDAVDRHVNDTFDGRIVRPENREALDPNTLEHRSNNPRPERVNIGLDLRKLRHEET